MKDTPPKRVTLREIAQKAGCSHVAVSLALRDSPRISKSRKLHIQDIAAEMGYRPDPVLRQLVNYRYAETRQRLHSTIGWINNWEDPKHFFKCTEFRRYFEGAQTAAEKLGYDIEPFNIQELKVSSKRLREIMLTRGIRGLIVPPQPSTFQIPSEGWDDFSILRIGFNSPNSNRHIVCTDQFEGGRIAALSMLKHGYKRIGYIGFKGKEERTRYHFLSGFQTHRDLHVPSDDIIPPLLLESENPEHGRASYQQWLEQNRIDAVFVSHPLVRQWTQELGLEVGKQLGMAGSSIYDSGFDSGLDQQPYEIGEVAMQFLSRLVEHQEFGVPKIPQRLLVSPTWVSGSSLQREA